MDRSSILLEVAACRFLTGLYSSLAHGLCKLLTARLSSSRLSFRLSSARTRSEAFFHFYTSSPMIMISKNVVMIRTYPLNSII